MTIEYSPKVYQTTVTDGTILESGVEFQVWQNEKEVSFEVKDFTGDYITFDVKIEDLKAITAKAEGWIEAVDHVAEQIQNEQK